MIKKSLLLTLLLAILAPWAAQAQETLTVHDGTITNAVVPMYGGYFDDYTKSEFVIPADDLAVMNGATITSMKFYISSVSTYGSGWDNTHQIVFLKEVESATLSAWSGTDGATIVFDGTFTVPASTDTEFEIEFTATYEYQGGNLLVGIYNTDDGSYRTVYWYGETVTGASGGAANSSSLNSVSFSQKNFIPKTTFTYEPAATGGCEKPDALMANGEPTDTEFSFNIVGGSGLYNIFTKAGDGDWTNWEYEWEDTEVNLTGLTGNTAYQVRVQSVCTDMTDPETGDAATSGWKTLSFTTKNPCAAPTNLQVSDITTESATLTWTAGYQETTWTVKYKKSTETTYTEETVNGTPTITLSGLTSGTVYDVQVYNCENYVSGTFNTECAAITTFPWSEDFDSYATGAFSHPCWVNEHISGNGSSVFQISSSNNQTGSTRTLQLPDMSNGTKTKLRLPEMTLASGDSYLFSIDVYRNTSGSSYTSEGVRVFASTDGEIEGATELGFLYRNCNQTDGGVVTAETATGWYTYEFPIPFTGTCYIVLRGENQYGSSTYMDNFKVKKELPCVKPADPTFVSSTTTSATLSWTNGAEGQTAWQIAYSTDPAFNPNEVTPVDVTSNPGTIDGLTHSTIYYAYVRANCGDLGYSEWSVAYCQFATACDAITTFPWSEDFEAYAAGDFSDPCWVNEHIEGSSTYIFKVSTSTMGSNSTHQLQLPDMQSGNMIKLVLPEMNLNGNYQFVLDVYRSNNTYQSNPYELEGIRVFASADGEIEGATEITFIPRHYQVSSDLIPAEEATGWYTYELPIPMTGTCYIILRGESQYCTSTYMDNFMVELAPTCLKPTNFAATNVTNHSATLGWTAGNEGQNAWQIAYSTTSFDPNVANFDLTTVTVIDSVVENTYTFNKTLAASTPYYIYVRGDCGDEDYSKWVGIDFTTGTANPSPTVTTVDEITPVSAVLRWTAAGGDYLESYDIYYSQTSGQPANDSFIQYTGVDAGFTSKILENLTEGYWYVYMRAYHGETDGYSSWTPYYGYGFQVPEACPEPTGLTASDPTPNSITLTWTEGAEWQYAWKVAYSTDPEFNPEDMDPETFVDVFGQQGPTITCTVNGLESETTYYFKVLGNCNSPYGDSDWTDAVSETTLVACPVPTDLNVTVAQTSATLNWNGYSDSYTVQYRTAGGYDFEIVQGFEEGLGEWTMNNCHNSTNVTTGYTPTHSGSAMFRFYYTSNYPQYLISPLLNGGNGGTMSFYYARYSNTYTEYFKVGYSTTTDDPEEFTWDEEVSVTNLYSTEFLEYTYTIPAGTKYVSIACTSNDRFYLFIDDITIQCGEYHETGEWITYNDNVTSTTATIEGLEFGTKYDAQVKANCGEEYSDYVTFTTMDVIVWNNSDDWTVPEEYADVTIPANTEVIIPSGFTAYADEITIEEGGQITMEPGAQLYHSNEIPVTVQMNVIGYDSGSKDGVGGFYLIASPINPSISAPAAGLIPENNEDPAYAGIDLYQFDQVGDGQGNEWLNYKVDNFDLNLMQGYLYASDATITAMFAGQTMPTNADLSKELEYVDSADLPGVNLVGNPFTCSAYINGGQAFYTMNKKGNEIVTAVSNTIDPLQGIFVEAEQAGDSVTFTTTPPETKGSLALNLSQGRGTIDRAIVRFGESSQLRKFQLNPNHTKVYIPMNGKDYAVVTAEEMGEMPVNFKAEKNGTYTLSFTAEEVNFNYLHLIDNMTGADVDLLATPSYTFEANTTDYATRFRLVFATGNNSTEDFAFFSNGNLVINNEGNATLQVVDVMGRIFSSETINGSASINLNGAAGVYMIRLINGENVKVQKVIIK